MNQQVKINGVLWDIEKQDDDIVIINTEVIDCSKILYSGIKELRDEAISKYGMYRKDTLRDEDGETLDYDSSVVTEYIDSSLPDYILSNIDDFEILEP